jgi:hypothetical protein
MTLSITGVRSELGRLLLQRAKGKFHVDVAGRQANTVLHDGHAWRGSRGPHRPAVSAAPAARRGAADQAAGMRGTHAAGCARHAGTRACAARAGLEAGLCGLPQWTRSGHRLLETIGILQVLRQLRRASGRKVVPGSTAGCSVAMSTALRRRARSAGDAARALPRGFIRGGVLMAGGIRSRVRCSIP